MIRFLPVEEICGNISVFLLLAWFCASVMEIKRPLLSVGLGMIMYGVVLPTLDVQPFVTENLPAALRFVCTMVVFWLFVQFSFVGKTGEKLLAYFLAYSLITISQVISTGILSLFRMDPMDYMEVVFAASSAIGFAFVFVASKCWKSVSVVAAHRRFWTLLLVPACQFALIALLVYVMTKTGGINLLFEASRHSWAALGIAAVFVLSLVADGIAMDNIIRMDSSIKEKERLRTLEMEQYVTYEYIKAMENDILEMRKYRHDLLNMLAAVQLTIESGDESRDEEALGLIRQMTQEISTITGKRYCDCTVVNCILGLAEERMTAEGIECRLYADVPEVLGVSELDLCRVMSNLFDNAREYCGRMPKGQKRWVHGCVRLCDSYLYVTVGNSYSGGKLSLVSSKADKKHHGLGLKILQQLTRKNGGELLFSEKDDAVEITATMRWEQPGENHM